MYDLRTRHESFSIEGYEKSVTLHEDGAYTLAFVKDALPTKKDHSELFLRANYDKYAEMGIIFRWKPNGDLFAGYYRKQYHLTVNLYAKKQWDGAIVYENGKIRTGKDFLWVLPHLLDYLGSECITNKEDRFQALFCTKTILKKIITGAITNRRDAMTQALAVSYKIKGADLTLVNKALEYISPSFMSQLHWFTTDFNNALRYIINAKENHECLQTFYDALDNARILNRRINPRWSEMRLQEEHEKMCDEITELKAGSLSDSPLYPSLKTPSLVSKRYHIKGHILDTERNTFREGRSMHHCVYTNYFYQIKNYNYMCLSLEQPCRCTVGLRVYANTDFETNVTEYTATCDQIYMSHNRRLDPKDEQRIRKWLDRELPHLTEIVNQGRSAVLNTKAETETEHLPF